ncbi:MAG: choice-of-anchor J domain-containing protein [Chitinophagaceae bacterium]|nr:choice-of-anchor J domain-containing protein [Chitinophagaceae bacterium]
MPNHNMIRACYIFISVVLLFTIMALFNACEKEETPAAPPPDYSYKEEFDTLENVINKGWLAINNSRPLGTSTWRQGIYGTGKGGGFTGIPAHSYKASAAEYAYVEYTCGEDSATLSCWLITPVLNIKNGDVISFWTRTGDPPVDYPDRLQVYANLTGDGTNVGDTENSIGDFKQLLFDINKDLTTTGYPTVWTKFEWTVIGVDSKQRSKARIGFRYYVTNGGPAGANSNYIGVDDFELKAN